MAKQAVPVKNSIVEAHRLTEGRAHYFYGYYDNPAWSGNDRFHLVHKADFWDRLPEKDDEAEIGMIDTSDSRYIPLATTTAWNFQQGSMLQWSPLAPDSEIIYNAREEGRFRGVVHNVHTGERRLLEAPVANVSPAGRYALSVSFARMFDFRPGYGYAGAEEPSRLFNHPDDDGIFRIDLQTGKSELILSLQQIWELTNRSFYGSDQRLLINHINFNTDGSRFVCLVRNFASGGRWLTAIVTANSDGSDPFLLSDYSYASHYHWRDPQRLVIHSKGAELGDRGPQLYVLQDKTHDGFAVDESFFLRDGHCSYSPDRSLMLYDSYPDAEQYRHLYVYNLAARKGALLGSYYSEPKIAGDYRCDLHPRWNRAGTGFSFDSTHEGRRHMYAADLTGVLSLID